MDIDRRIVEEVLTQYNARDSMRRIREEDEDKPLWEIAFRELALIQPKPCRLLEEEYQEAADTLRRELRQLELFDGIQVAGEESKKWIEDGNPVYVAQYLKVEQLTGEQKCKGLNNLAVAQAYLWTDTKKYFDKAKETFAAAVAACEGNAKTIVERNQTTLNKEVVAAHTEVLVAEMMLKKCGCR